MNIAFDAKRAFLNQSGLGNYSRTLIQSLVDFYPEHSYTLFTTEQKHSAFSEEMKTKHNVQIITPKNNSSIPTYWRSFSLNKENKKHNINIYHGLSNELSFGRNSKTKLVVTIHDLIFLRYPNLYPFIDKKLYTLKVKYACKKADIIIAVSQQTKEDIIDFLKIKESKIKVIYQSCDKQFSDPITIDFTAVKQKYNLPPKYLLYVGTIEERKNLLTIIKSLPFINSDIPLVIIGKRKKYFKEVQSYIIANNLSTRVYFLENIDFMDLPSIYKNASVFIYPSLFEGFGIPIIEALWSKVPVISSVGSCFIEAGGSNSIYINPIDFNDLADKINQVLSSEELRDTIVLKGFEYVQQFSLSTTSSKMMHLYKSLI